MFDPTRTKEQFQDPHQLLSYSVANDAYCASFSTNVNYHPYRKIQKRFESKNRILAYQSPTHVPNDAAKIHNATMQSLL